MDVTYYGGSCDGRTLWYPEDHIFDSEIVMTTVRVKGKKKKPDEVYELVADMAFYKGTRDV